MFIPKVMLYRCMCGGCAEGEVWRAWHCALLRGHSETTWDLTENTSVMGHTASVVRCLFLIVIVIYFQVFCFLI